MDDGASDNLFSSDNNSSYGSDFDLDISANLTDNNEVSDIISEILSDNGVPPEPEPEPEVSSFKDYQKGRVDAVVKALNLDESTELQLQGVISILVMFGDSETEAEEYAKALTAQGPMPVTEMISLIVEVGMSPDKDAQSQFEKMEVSTGDQCRS